MGKHNSLVPNDLEKMADAAARISALDFVGHASAVRHSTPPAPGNGDGARKRCLMLADAIKRAGAWRQRPDPEPIANQVVLLGEDGTITPLLSDDASRSLCGRATERPKRAALWGPPISCGLPLLAGRHDRSRRARAGSGPPNTSARSARSA